MPTRSHAIDWANIFRTCAPQRLCDHGENVALNIWKKWLALISGLRHLTGLFEPCFAHLLPDVSRLGVPVGLTEEFISLVEIHAQIRFLSILGVPLVLYI